MFRRRVDRVPFPENLLPTVSPMVMVHCPTCSNLFDADQRDTMPFCCERCRTIDLGVWLDERYGIPYESDGEELDVEG